MCMWGDKLSFAVSSVLKREEETGEVEAESEQKMSPLWGSARGEESERGAAVGERGSEAER